MLHVFWIFFPLLPGYALQRRGRDLQGTLTPSFAPPSYCLKFEARLPTTTTTGAFRLDLIWNVWIFLSFLFSSTNVFVVVLTRLGSELHRDTCPYFLKKISIFFNWKFSTKCIEEGNSKKIGLNVKREGTVLSYCRVKIHSFVDKICRNKLNENTISLISCRYATLRPDIELHEIQHFFS